VTIEMKKIIKITALLFFLFMIVMSFVSNWYYKRNTIKVEVTAFTGGTLEQSAADGEKKEIYFEKCIPVDALHQGAGNRYYVLIAGEKETVLGEEKVAVECEVRVLAKGTDKVAIQSEVIGAASKIIVAASGKIEDGTRIEIN
jgi:hypothetical protein